MVWATFGLSRFCRDLQLRVHADAGKKSGSKLPHSKVLALIPSLYIKEVDRFGQGLCVVLTTQGSSWQRGPLRWISG
jgi:hypothetical protein